MKLFNRSVELIVIRDVLNPQRHESYYGNNIEKLSKEAFGGQGLSENIRLYHGNFLDEVTPKTPDDVDNIMHLNGRIYAVVKPMGVIEPWVVSLIISVTVAVATAFLMPVPTLPNQNSSAAPSPNNALAARANKQRLGGRIPDIFGTGYSFPDLTAVTYSVYIDHKEVEMSAYRVGRGKHHVFEAYDDTTPINQVFGSSVLVFDPDTTFDDTPAFQFGSAFTADEAEWSRKVAKRYTSVNGQTLQAPDSYLTVATIFKNPNIIETSSNADFRNNFAAGDTILIEGADNLASANGVTEGVEPDETDVTYTLNGQYEILTVTEKQIILSNPAAINSDWGKLADNIDLTVESDAVTLSTESDTFWQGWHYTDLKEHESAYINITAAGLYDGEPDATWRALRLFGQIESEIVDSSNNPVAGTLVTQEFSIQSPNSDGFAFGAMKKGYQTSLSSYTDNKIRTTANKTVVINNPNFVKGKRLRWRAARTSNVVTDSSGGIVDELKIKDFYGIRSMVASDYMPGTTNVLSKTLGTEGALSLKERKLRLLVQRYVTDATTGILKLSNRADDIIRHIATDPKIGNLDLSQIDIAQIKTEVDNIVTYFGTEKCAEFCGTFDDNNLSAEETIQTVARAVFSQAKRQGNKIMLDFERLVPGSAAIFNSHNILPDTYSAPQSFGVNSDYDGAKVEYTDPIDDATVTLSYPSESIVNPHEEKLIGVRNKIQAHMHAMRILNRDLFVYKSCEFTAGDESNIVVRTNRITVADQLRANVQQGTVSSIETVGSDIVLHTDYPIDIAAGTPQTMFIQTINNGVEAIEVTARDDYSMTLARLPSGEISTGPDSVVQAVFVTNADTDRDAYLITEKSPSEGMTNKLTCTNYDDRYYQNDTDHINGLIT
ncbi:host specificity factor TipJ family phage tail protein [Psychrobacter sp. JB193]|uniref:host specificity factor TipJ family phage tail protein n=1 Tax=Psychrobacter sp. JB193 TaxID=2024406 RepID=UPI000BAADC42|nr:host specificity factor TipJ family phage tail protein [Psychrobacter sp. JB193]PAT63916.1 hypothetical protein CIK80_02050 [Psychrobacter sp. JB193]